MSDKERDTHESQNTAVEGIEAQSHSHGTVPEPSADGNVKLCEVENDQTTNLESEEIGDTQSGNNYLQRAPSKPRELWRFRMRPSDDDEPEDWWFASTAIPLLAATLGPLANVLSIAAIVVYWRAEWAPGQEHVQDDAKPYRDPSWCLALNICSLVCGFVGNAFLLLNFTRRIRYIVALPMTIVFWTLATAILIAITVSIHIYEPPSSPDQIYTQGFWHAIIAAVLYMVCSMLLTINMLGYFLGHYTQHFDLTDEQRNLILQTMMFFIWLAGGAGVFSRVCGWSYTNALYFCDVTILTVGFGDFAPPNDPGRGLVFPYSVGGIIILGLMVSSIQKFAKELGHDRIVKKQVETKRVHTVERAVTSSFEAEKKDAIENSQAKAQLDRGSRPTISTPFNPQRTIAFAHVQETGHSSQAEIVGDDTSKSKPRRRRAIWKTDQSKSGSHLKRITSRKSRLLVLREEKDRFEAMRSIQDSTRRFKRYFALTMSVLAFGILWCVGALVFWQAEQDTLEMTYFQALYFCYVSLLTIGYGDLAPRSNAGKPFFIVWSLIAVPTMTILISDMSETVVASYKHGTFVLADWTVLTRVGIFREFLDKHPALCDPIDCWRTQRAEQKRIKEGFQTGPQDEEDGSQSPTRGSSPAPTSQILEQLADQEPDEHELARRLTKAIRRTADHLKRGEHKRYSYEEWAEYSQLIQFSRSKDEDDQDEVEIVEWDWIGENSPMMADQSEAEWVLDRLCESMERYVRKHCRPKDKKRTTDVSDLNEEDEGE